ncbi:hypothetical protein FHS52_000009 [Erythromicrobium ramosum]|uniref:Uncharacterized protein n=1 Tax=Erythrobacter ramosus TaxID=35811 RepID=A0ABR6HTS5_9SPHN|nr:hypothetical protein [Erythrobacter ramosus]MBB3774066.1 hypothetical protein [Erythrobacter ramosus]
MVDQADKDRFLKALTELGGSAGNVRLREALQWDEEAYPRTTTGDHFGELDVGTNPRLAPANRRGLEVAKIGELVGQLDLLGIVGGNGCLEHLETFTLKLVEALVVGDLKHQTTDSLAEAFGKLLSRSPGVLYRVVQDRCCEDVRVLHPGLDQDVRHVERVVDVGRRIDVLAALLAVTVGSKACRTNDHG